MSQSCRSEPVYSPAVTSCDGSELFVLTCKKMSGLCRLRISRSVIIHCCIVAFGSNGLITRFPPTMMHNSYLQLHITSLLCVWSIRVKLTQVLLAFYWLTWLIEILAKDHALPITLWYQSTAVQNSSFVFFWSDHFINAIVTHSAIVQCSSSSSSSNCKSSKDTYRLPIPQMVTPKKFENAHVTISGLIFWMQSY